MNLGNKGINFLLIAETGLLMAVLLLGVFVGIRDIVNVVPEDTRDSQDYTNESQGDTEGDSSAASGTENTEANLPWSIPIDYTEGRVEFSAAVEAKLIEMTIEQKVAQLFIITPEALTGVNNVTRFGNASKEALDRYPVGGLVYGVNNFQGAIQASLLIKGAKEYSLTRYGYDIFTLVLEDAAKAELLQTGEIDILNDLAAFPGMDTSGKSFEDLCNGELLTYDDAFTAGAKFLFVDTNVVECITGDASIPCILSPRTVALLRGSMGYQGLIITSSLSEVEYGTPEDCVTAIQAGMDMIYLPLDFAGSYQAVLEAVSNGSISEERLHNAVGRILTVKGI